MVELAVIGGTGVYDPDILVDLREIEVETPYGPPVKLTTGIYEGKEVAFLPRHGSKHGVPPHKINYRANMAALKKIGVKRVYATAAVGSMNRDMKPGEAVLLDQFIDFTKSRITTYYDGGEAGVVHTDFTEPYCSELRGIMIAAAKEEGVILHERGTYICTEGPRFETSAEIRLFSSWGADVVGMTNVPEVTLARELGLCYCTIALVTNFAAGIAGKILTHQEVLEAMANNIINLRKLLARGIRNTGTATCRCSSFGTPVSLTRE
ncbi:MAG TPA: S-methyl-5'-thioadenosine phosphorylase [Firmicutes bacterium]|nr:S-methyl-5'-thioadenosine phosphorylase [Bacillota bacterium]